MKLNFNILRIELAQVYNRVVDKLEDAKNLENTVVIPADELEIDMRRMRELIITLTMCEGEDLDTVKSVHEKIDEFKHFNDRLPFE